MMQAEGYRQFKMQQHTDLWKAENARDPSFGLHLSQQRRLLCGRPLPPPLNPRNDLHVHRSGLLLELQKEAPQEANIAAKAPFATRGRADAYRDPKLGFGSPVFGKEGWGWNEKWVTRVRTYCEERYGKRENSRAQSEAGEPSQHLAKRMPPEGNDERP